MSLNEEDTDRWKKFVEEAKKLAHSGKVAQALLLFKRASKLQATEKLANRIKRLEVINCAVFRKCVLFTKKIC